MQIRVWAKYYGTERVYVENNSPYDDRPERLDHPRLGDQRLPHPARRHGGPGATAASARSSRGDLNLNNLPATNNAFEGDAVFLMEPAGGGLATGNLRAWFPYPCNPDECADPQAGRAAITDVAVPGARPECARLRRGHRQHRRLRARSRCAGPRRRTSGGPGVTYTVTAASPNGGTIPAAVSGVTGLETTVIGAVGRAYTFTVSASNGAGTSSPSSPSGAVTPIGPHRPRRP